MTIDVLVIGGGLAGLTAAACAARSGARTVLLEASARPGGRASTDTVDGFAFDRGAHALYTGGDAARTLADLGVVLPSRAATTAGSVVVHEGEVHPLPDGLLALGGARWLGPGGRLSLAGWFARVGMGATPTGTAEAWLDDLPGPVRSLARAFVRVSTYSGDLHRMDAGFAATQARLGLRGVHYVEGGWQVMVDALAHRARALGVTIRTGLPAQAVDAEGATTAEGRLTARVVVLAVPPPRASALLGRPLPGGPPPTRVAALQLALRDGVVSGPTRRLVLDGDTPVFVSNFSTVVRLGPDGCQVVHAIRYLPDDAPVADARGDIERTLDRVWPAWREGVVAERWLPAMVSAGALPEPGRPRLALDAVDGVLLAGDAYGDQGHLADAAVASGREAARRAWERLHPRSLGATG